MENNLYLLAGTYTKEKGEGLIVYRFDARTGEATYVQLTEVDNASYLTAKDNWVYTVSENEDNPSYANAFSFQPESGELTFLNRQETKGAGPCNIVLSPDQKYVITANYAGGSLSVFPLLEDGRLSPVKQVIEFGGQGVDKDRQEAPHLHCVKFSPEGKFLFATDLGTDKLYRFEKGGTDEDDFIREESLMLFKVEDGSGPRHFVFHPSGKYLYLINELSGTIVAFIYEEGALTELQTIKASETKEQDSGDIAITPDGKFLYTSHREDNDGISIFSIHTEDGTLTKTGYQPTGSHPRNLAITPDGTFLLSANKDSHSIEIFRISKDTGKLTATGKDIPVNSPVCLLFIPVRP